MILAMDTATSEMTVALVQNDTVVAEYSETVDRSHSAALLPAIDRVLKTAGTEVADLRAIAVGRGRANIRRPHRGDGGENARLVGGTTARRRFELTDFSGQCKS